MAVSLKDRLILWSRAGHRCSLSECRTNLLWGADSDDPTLIGECCHIVGESRVGPRGNHEMSPDDRDRYSNLILLCRNHHKVVDADVAGYTTAKLRDIKKAHESWVDSALAPDLERLKDDLAYADIVDKWVEAFDVNEWDDWGSRQLMLNRIDKDQFHKFQDSVIWLARRVWPSRHRKLEESLAVFLRVMKDLVSTLEFYLVEERSDGEMVTERFYKREWYAQKVYAHRLMQYEIHVEITEQLVKEATKACNLVCDAVRATLDYSFRREEGVVVLSDGAGTECAGIRLEYDHRADVGTLYRGLDKIREAAEKKVRADRRWESWGPLPLDMLLTFRINKNYEEGVLCELAGRPEAEALKVAREAIQDPELAPQVRATVAEALVKAHGPAVKADLSAACAVDPMPEWIRTRLDGLLSGLK